MEHNEKNLNYSGSITLNDIIQVGLMAALTFVATALIHIPSFMGVVHLGDSMIFVGAIILGKKKGAISAAIGMTLFDVVHGYTTWAPFTFIIKGYMGYIAGIIAYRKSYRGENLKNNLFACIVAGIAMIIGYYVCGAMIARFIVFKTATLNQAFIIALKDIPGNIAQVVGGIIIGIPITIPLKKALKSANIKL